MTTYTKPAILTATLSATALSCAICAPAMADLPGDVKIGILLGFTGPIESMTPAIADSAELALKEASESGKLLGGKTVGSSRGDSTCIDAAAATAAAERLSTADKVSAAHEDGKADYSAEVGALAASGAGHLAVFGYADQGGKGVVQAALDFDAFDSFVMSDGMIAQSLIDALGDELTGSVGTLPGNESDGAKRFQAMTDAAGISTKSPYTGEAYDAAALIVLAMQAANSSDRSAIQSRILDVANAPGEIIHPGEPGKALEILAGGGDVNYAGATAVELTDSGDASGTYKEMEITDKGFELVAIH